LADVNSNINVNFNTADALAQLRRLQAGLSKFHQTLAEGNLAAANAQKGLNAQLFQSIGATGKFAVSQAKVASSTMAFTSALEKNKLSLREYYRYSMAAATANTKVLGRAFAREREIINRARRDRVKALQAQYIQMAKAQGGFMEAMRIMPRTLMMANGRFTELGTRIQYAAQRQQFLNQLLRQGSTQLLNFGKNTQWAGRQLMVGLTMPLALLGGYAAKAFRDLEKATVKFRRVYGDAFTNDAQIDEAVQNVRKLAEEYTKFGVAVVDTMDMAATAAAAGFQGEDLTRQVETATKLAVLGQVEQQQALETTISLQNAFGLSSEQLAEKINFLNAVENQTVLSIEDLTIAIPKAAPIVKQLGGSVEDLAFFLTAMKEGGINASEGANALKSGLASLINPTEKASEMLGKMGINIKGIVEANQGDLKGTVVGFSRALDTLDPLNRARAIEQLFGKFQFARLSTLFQNVSKDGTQAARAFDLAGASVEELAVLSEREMKKIEESVGVKFQAAVENFKQDIMPLGKAFLEAITPIVKFFGGLFEKFNSLGDHTKKVIAIIIGIVAGLGPIVLMTFGLLMNGLANLIKLFSVIRGGIAKLNGQTTILGAGFNYVTQEQIEQQAAGQALHNTHTRLTEVFNIEKVAALQLASAYQQMATQMRAMALQNPTLFTGGLSGARGAVSKLPQVPPVKKYEEGVVSVPGPKGAGDVVPAMVSPGEAIIPAKTSEKYRGLIHAMFADKVPGYSKGLLPWGSSHPVKQSGAVDIGMPKKFSETTQARQVAEKISRDANVGQYAKMKVQDMGELVKPFTGYSFPVKGVGGVYKQKDGKLVVVKPTMSPSTAMGDIRSNDLTRLHGISAPKPKLVKILDPTDPEGKRSYLALVSKYDKKFGPEGMTGKFTQKDMVKQLVASSIRADRDLQMSNVSGRSAPDPSNAYVFPKGSGFREISLTMPSMEQTALANTLAFKGGSKKFFAQQTSALASKMSPQQYDQAIKDEIRRVLPLYKKEISSGKNFQNLDALEKQAYANVITRLENGLKTDWTKVHAAHIRAGQQVPQYSKGNLSPWEIAVAKRENQTQISSLIKQINNDAGAALTTLKTVNPSQYQKAIEKLQRSGILQDGKIDISQSETLRKLFKEKLLIDPDKGAFLKDAFEKGKTGKSLDYLRSQTLYRLGLMPSPIHGNYTSQSKGISKLREDFSVKSQSGNWKQYIKDGPLKKALLAEEAKFTNANKASEITANLRTKLKELGYTETAINKFLRTELSHIAKTAGAPGIGKEKWLSGFATFDRNLINSFVNPGAVANPKNTTLGQLLSWNANNQYRLYDRETAKVLQQASAFLKSGQHPISADQAKMVQLAAQARIRAEAFLEQQGGRPKGFPNLGSVSQAKAVDYLIDQQFKAGLYKKQQRAVRAIFDLSSGSTQSENVNISRNARASLVGVKPGEVLYNVLDQTYKKLTKQNTQPLPANVIPIDKKRKRTKDTRSVKVKKPEIVAKPNQITALSKIAPLRTSRGVLIPGHESAPEAGQRLAEARAKKLRQSGRNLTEEQIKDAVKRQQKNDEKIADNKAKQAKLAANTTKREEIKAKDEAYRARQSLRIAAAHDEALKINEARNQAEKAKAAKQARKDARREKIQMRQEKVGRYSGGMSMALGTAGMGMMMTGNTGAGMALMGASAVAGMAPMLANPYIAAGVAATALAGSFYLADKAGKKHAEAMSKLVDATSATTEKMKKIGELTDKVGASEIMSRRRNQQASDRFTTGFERGKQRFGTTFLESEVGKDVLGGFKESLVRFGTEISASQMATQLGAYVSDGVLSAEQAHSVAEAIGLNLKNTTLGAQISGQLLELIGPEGQDLLKDPLNTRVNLVNQQRDTGKQVSKNLATNLAGYNNSFDNVASQLSKVVIPGIGIPTAVMGAFQKAPGFLNYSFGEMFKQTSGESMASGSAAIGTQNLELNQSQIDSLTIQYEKEIAKLEKEKASTTNKEKQLKLEAQIRTMKDDQVTQTADLRKVNGDILKDQVEAFKVASKRGAVEDAFFDSLKSQVKTKWANDPMADAFLKTSADLDSKELEVKIDTIVASGQMSPMAAVSLMQMFGDDEKGLDKVLTVSTKFSDPGKFMEVINFFGGFKNKDIGKKNVKILTRMAQKDPEQAEKIMATLMLMQKMDNKEIDIEAFFEGDDAQQRLTDLADSLQEVEDHKGPFTLKALTEVKELGGVNLDGILSRWAEFENLPEEVRKTVVQEYITLVKQIDDKSVDAEIARRVKAAGGAETLRDYYATEAGRESVRRDMAGIDTMQKVKQDIASNNANNYEGQDKGGKKADPFEDIMKRLKNVRNAAINAAGGFKELQKAIAAAGSKSVANKFVGIEQQLMKKGYSDDFINYITNLDPEAQKEFGFTATKKGKKKYKEFDYEKGKMVTRTQKYKKGDFVLTDKGNAMRQGMDKAVVGEFQVEQQKVIKNINQQNKAYATLRAAGLSNLEIEKAMENQTYVTAIATGKITAQELKTNNVLTQQRILREQIKGLVDKTKTNETRIDALKKTPDLINFLSGLKTIDATGKEVSLSMASIYDAIQDPEDLISMIAIMDQIKSGTGDTQKLMKDLFNLISTSESAKDLEKNLLTPLEKFQKAYDAAMKVFDAYKTMDEYTLKSNVTGMADSTGVNQFNGKTFKQLSRSKTESDEALAAMNAELAIYEHQISMISDEIEKIERSVENMDVKELNLTVDGKKVTGKLKYVLEDLKEQISDWEREIEMKYDRPIKTLQEESNVLSHDLEVMNYQAGKISDRYDEQAEALEEVQKVNESIIRQQEQQLDLADALTQGDISAAARAAQAMRASNAQDFATGQGDALTQARDNAIKGLTNANGLTKDQIEERRWQISQQIYALENDPQKLALEKSILEAKDAIYAIEEKREGLLLAIRAHEEKIYEIEQNKILPLQTAINLETTKNLALDYQLTVLGNIIAANDRNREVAGQTREQWEEILAQQTLIDEKLRKQIKEALDGFNADSSTAAQTWAKIKSLYDEIKSKTVTITVNYETGGSSGGNGATGSTGATGATGATGFTSAQAAASYAAAKAAGDLNAAALAAAKVNPSVLAAAESGAIGAASIASQLKKAEQQQKFYSTYASFKAKEIADAAKFSKTAVSTTPIHAGSIKFKSAGGLITKYFAAGGMPLGTDTVPAMLTPGEFVMSKYAVNTHGIDTMKAINGGESVGDSVYNYSISVNVKSDANPDEIAQAVMTNIQRVNSQKLRSVRL